MRNIDNWAENFKTFKKNAFRLESLPQYLVKEEKDSFAAFLKGEAYSEPNCDHLSWLKTIESAISRNAHFSRIHIVPEILTDYLRFEIQCYKINAQSGDDIRFIYQKDVPEKWLSFSTKFDFWLFDDELLFEILYSKNGEYIEAKQINNQKKIKKCIQCREEFMALGISLADFCDSNSL